MPNEKKNLQQLAEEDVDAIKKLWKKLVVDDVENKIQQGISSIDQKIAALPTDEDFNPSKKEITEIKKITQDVKTNCTNIDLKQKTIIEESASLNKTISEFNSNIERKYTIFEKKIQQLSDQNSDNKKYLSTLLRKQNKIPAYLSDLKRLSNIMIKTETNVYRQNSVIQQNINILSDSLKESQTFNKEFKENVIKDTKDIHTKLENQNTQQIALNDKFNSMIDNQNKSIDLSKELKESINNNNDEIKSIISNMPEMQNAISSSIQEMREYNKDLLRSSRIKFMMYILITASGINLALLVCQILRLF